MTSRGSWLDDLPFPKRWLGYIAVKALVLAVVLLVVLHFSGVL